MKLSLERTVQWNWRTYFQPSVILSAEKDVRTGKILNFTLSEDGRTAEARSERGFNMIVRDIPTTIEQYRDYPEWTVLEL